MHTRGMTRLKLIPGFMTSQESDEFWAAGLMAVRPTSEIDFLRSGVVANLGGFQVERESRENRVLLLGGVLVTVRHWRFFKKAFWIRPTDCE